MNRNKSVLSQKFTLNKRAIDGTLKRGYTTLQSLYKIHNGTCLLLSNYERHFGKR